MQPTAAPALLLASMIPDLSPDMAGLIFYVLAGLCVVSSVVAATATKIVHAAFGLMASFFGVAGLYALLGADFVALAQVLVYVGGILVLLVFGILLTGRLRGSLGLERPPRTWPAVVAGGLLFLGFALALSETTFPGTGAPALAKEPTTAPLGRALLD